MKPRVLKFGGSSVADAARMRQVLSVVREALPHAPLVVLSAMGKTTDALFRAARAARGGDLGAALVELEGVEARAVTALRELSGGTPADAALSVVTAIRDELELLLRGVALLRELTPRSQDAIASAGERLSTLVFAALAEREGLAVTRVDAREVMRTDAGFGAAQPRPPEIARLAAARLRPHLGPGRIVVTEGYIGATEDGLTTTLGRGGSDYSAALFGAAVEAAEIQIWTDVEGVLTADPRVVPAALPLPQLSFAEAAELAAFGAKVLHPATIQPAVERGIPVTVRHTERPRGAFTTITAGSRSGRPVAALASRGPISVLTVTSTRMLAQSGFLARLFEVFGRLGVSVDLVATAEVSVSLTVDAGAPLEAILGELRTFSSAAAVEGRAIVAVVGDDLKHTPGLGGRIFGALEDINVEMVSMGGNELNLSLVVRQEDAAEAVRRLHRALIEEPAAPRPRAGGGNA